MRRGHEGNQWHMIRIVQRRRHHKEMCALPVLLDTTSGALFENPKLSLRRAINSWSTSGSSIVGQHRTQQRRSEWSIVCRYRIDGLCVMGEASESPNDSSAKAVEDASGFCRSWRRRGRRDLQLHAHSHLLLVTATPHPFSAIDCIVATSR